MVKAKRSEEQAMEDLMAMVKAGAPHLSEEQLEKFKQSVLSIKENYLKEIKKIPRP